MTLPSVREHTDAVATKLQALGLTVGVGEAPVGVNPPYAVVYPIPGGDTSGPLGDQHADAELVYQITAVGVSREQAEWVADKALGLLDGFTVTGRKVLRVDLEIHGGIQHGDDPDRERWYATPRFRIRTTPA